VIKDEKTLRTDIQNFVKQTLPQEESNDKDYVFLYFIMNYLPKGLIGLLIAVILCAAMSSISAELNALSGTTTIDIFKRFFSSNLTEQSEVNWTKGFTILWGVIAIGFALTANLFENLIQFINIIGSLFYGTVLGIFLVAFYSKTVKSNAVFISALIAQAVIFLLFFYSDLGFLWYNVIACGIVFVCSYLIQIIDKSGK
jgi:Na+/proline symporter